MLAPRPVEPTAEGDYRLRLSEAERALLRSLPAQLAERIRAGPDDPALRRLFPRAHERDDEEEEYRRLVGDELVEGRLAALRLVEETAERDRLSAAELDAWLRALTDLRLVLGTRLDVTEETYAQAFDPADPRAYELSVFTYLSWLQEQLVEAAAGGLGPG